MVWGKRGMQPRRRRRVPSQQLRFLADISLAYTVHLTADISLAYAVHLTVGAGNGSTRERAQANSVFTDACGDEENGD